MRLDVSYKAMCRGSATTSALHKGCAGLAKCEVDSLLAEQRMRVTFETQNAVIAQPVWAAPDHEVTVMERNAVRTVRAFVTAEQKHRAHPERHRHDRRAEVALVLVLVQG